MDADNRRQPPERQVTGGGARVLVVDDDPAILRALELNLKAHNYVPMLAATGQAALRSVAADPPELVILDLGLPGMSGVEVISGLRGWTSVPVIVLTARHEEKAKVEALDAGADDYLTKPFGIGELLARMRAVMRRSAPTVDEPVVVTDWFRVDLDLRSISLMASDEPVKLTPTEWAIVEFLVRNPGRLVTTRQLLDHVWSPSYEPDNTLLRVHIQHIRRKLEPAPDKPRYFLTETGLGYRFEP